MDDEKGVNFKESIKKISKSNAKVDNYIKKHKIIRFLIIFIFLISWGYALIMVGRFLQCEDTGGILMKTDEEGYFCVNASVVDDYNKLNSIVNRELDLPDDSIFFNLSGGGEYG